MILIHGYLHTMNGSPIADGFIEILSLQLAGKKRMSSDEFLRGFNLEDKKLS